MVDKNGITIEEFDILKIFHFIGPRRKKFYMYKTVIKYKNMLYISHISSNPLVPGCTLDALDPNDTEIVQSKNWSKLND